MESESTESATVGPWSCFNCRRRKVRCDRVSPCIHCSKAGIDCAFPASGRMPTRRHDLPSFKDGKTKQKELLDRIRRLEGLVEGLSTQFEGQAAQVDPSLHNGMAQGDCASSLLDTAWSETTMTLDDTFASSEPTKEFGRLFTKQNGTMYIGNRFWAVLWDELKYVRHALEANDEPDFDPVENLSEERSDRFTSFPWARKTNEHAVLRPLPSQISFIWEIFADRVDPFVKVLHLPTTFETIRQAKCQFTALNPGMQALILSVSLAAIRSLSQDEVMSSFGEPKEEFLSRYTLGTEQALANASILDTTDLSVIQAFIIYLETMDRKKGMRAVWSLTGLLIRAAESMGLHRDGSHFPDLSPFQIEMRRRVWWHICFVDSKVGDCQVSEVSISEQIFDTQQPSNLNDVDIHSEMASIPTSKIGFTDSTLSLIKCELWRSSRRIQSFMSLLRSRKGDHVAGEAQLLDALAKSRQQIVTDWIHRVGPDVPLRVFAKAFADLNFSEHELVIQHRDLFRDAAKVRDMTPSRSQEFFLSALAGFECTLDLVTQEATAKWAWIFHDQVQWPAISIILVQLCTLPWGPTCEHAWVVVQRMFETFADLSKTQILQPPMRGLITAVQRHRADEIQRLSMLPVVTLRLGEVARHQSNRNMIDPDPFCTTTTLDISAAQQRFTLEIAISQGEVLPQTNSDSSDQSNASDVALQWEAIWRVGDISRIAAGPDLSTLFPVEVWTDSGNIIAEGGF